MSKQLVLQAMQNLETERVPWVPFVGCHAASLLGISAKEYFMSAENIVRGVGDSIKLYRPDGIPTLFDLQVEAEAMGCKLRWADNNPPSVATHPLEDGVQIEDLKIPTESDGRFPIVLDATRQICEKFGSDVAIYALVTGPFTLALHLMGTDIFFEMIDNPERMHKLMEFCRDVCINTSKMYIDCGVDIVAVVDPMTSQISPQSFEEFVTPYATNVFDFIREKGKLSSFFVCGNAKRNIEEMCKCSPDNISIDENIPLSYVKDVCEKYDISFGGNIKLTVTMLFGTPTDNMNDAKNCMAIGGNKGFILSPGCDMPYAVPVNNVKAIVSVVYDEMVQFMEEEEIEKITIELPDYVNEKKVIIDVITLDSESCAPCQYMMNAVREACSKLSDDVSIVEHKVKEKESVAFMIALGVQNIPTICIDGEIKFVSIIPDVPSLRREIEKTIMEKSK